MNDRRRNPQTDHATGDVVISALLACFFMALCFVPQWIGVWL